MRTRDSDRLVAGVLDPSVVQPSLTRTDIDGHTVVGWADSELVAHVGEDTRCDNPVEERSELVRIVCPVTIHRVVETTRNGHALIPFSRSNDLSGATASEVDTEAVTIPLGTRRH